MLWEFIEQIEFGFNEKIINRKIYRYMFCCVKKENSISTQNSCIMLMNDFGFPFLADVGMELMSIYQLLCLKINEKKNGYSFKDVHGQGAY